MRTTEPPRASDRPQREIALVDLLDRLLGTGVVLAGDITISLAGVDLVLIKLRALIMSVRDEMEEAER
ncbi:MAG: gas vesicle protein [Streptosporangiales bacterium]|nr:gas vesicle protein [Streptosporangiales bacterium]MBO0889697.1 gas vesicle protein [Acidothermales bacterium]